MADHHTETRLLLQWYYPPTIAVYLNLFLLFVATSTSIIHFFYSLTSTTFSSTSPFRWLLSILLPAVLAASSYHQKSVSFSGCIAGTLIAIVILLTNSVVFVALVLCYFCTSWATKHREDIKSQFEAHFKQNGQRIWVQIVCNLGVACTFCLLQLIIYGVGAESEIDFHKPSDSLRSHTFSYGHQQNPTLPSSSSSIVDTGQSWLLVAALGSISSALGDTLSSELGPVWSEHSPPLLITTFQEVPKGTNGAVTIGGLFAACLGGFIIGLGSFLSLCVLQFDTSSNLHYHSPQWPIILFCLYAGIFGSLTDSVLGATCQYTGYDHLRRRVVEQPPNPDNPGTYVEHISGRHLLDNHSVNLISITVTSILIATLASRFWPAGMPMP